MRHVEVLGFDCAACRKTFRVVEETARTLGLAIRLEKVDDAVRILAYRALSVAVNGRLVHTAICPRPRK